MAFIASQLALQRGFEALLSVAAQQKVYLAGWSSKLAGNITALDGLTIISSVNQAVTLMDQYAALPGMAGYAQTQFGNASYNVAAEYTAMRAALVAMRDWLTANIPSNAVTITNGVQVGAVYTPAQTSGLKALVDAAAATIA